MREEEKQKLKNLIGNILVLGFALICLFIAVYPLNKPTEDPFLTFSGFGGILLGFAILYMIWPEWIREHKRLLEAVKSLENDMVSIMEERDPKLVNFVKARFASIERQVKRL